MINDRLYSGAVNHTMFNFLSIFRSVREGDWLAWSGWKGIGVIGKSRSRESYVFTTTSGFPVFDIEGTNCAIWDESHKLSFIVNDQMKSISTDGLLDEEFGLSNIYLGGVLCLGNVRCEGQRKGVIAVNLVDEGIEWLANAAEVRMNEYSRNFAVLDFNNVVHFPQGTTVDLGDRGEACVDWDFSEEDECVLVVEERGFFLIKSGEFKRINLPRLLYFTQISVHAPNALWIVGWLPFSLGSVVLSFDLQGNMKGRVLYSSLPIGKPIKSIRDDSLKSLRRLATAVETVGK